MPRDLIAGVLVVVLACGAAVIWVIHERRPVVVASVAVEEEPAPIAPVAPARLQAPGPIAAPVARLPQTRPSGNNTAPAPAPTRITSAQPQAAPLVVTEELGRQALNMVGIDDEAGQVWYSAINNPTLLPNARKNLIEDLNETGFADPHNLTRDDLTLIDSRISIIEQIGPDAMDQINAAAFQEAYKDLINMRVELVGQ